jgi:hypothetical protein
MTHFSTGGEKRMAELTSLSAVVAGTGCFGAGIKKSFELFLFDYLDVFSDEMIRGLKKTAGLPQ